MKLATSLGMLLLVYATTAMAADGDGAVVLVYMLMAGILLGIFIGGIRARLAHKSIILGALGGMAFVLFALFAFAVYYESSEQQKQVDYENKKAEIKSLLVPLETLKAGEMRVELAPLAKKITSDSFASKNDETEYLVFEYLPETLDHFHGQSPLTRDDIVALKRFYTDYGRRAPQHFIWLEHLLDIDAALTICNTEISCQLDYLKSLKKVCFEDSTRCKQSLSFEKTHHWQNLFKDKVYGNLKLERLLDIAEIDLFIFSEKYSNQDYAKGISSLNITLRIIDHIFDDLSFLDKVVAKSIEIEKQKFGPAMTNDKFQPSPELAELQGLIPWTYYDLSITSSIEYCQNKLDTCLWGYTKELMNYCEHHQTDCNNIDTHSLAEAIRSSNIQDKEKKYQQFQFFVKKFAK